MDIQTLEIVKKANQLVKGIGTRNPHRMAEYSAQVEHPDRFELNSLTAKTEQSSRRD